MIAWTLQPTRTGPHLLTRVGIHTSPTTGGQVGELLLTPTAYADLARRLDVAHCAGCGRQLPASEAHAGFTKCEACEPLQVPATLDIDSDPDTRCEACEPLQMPATLYVDSDPDTRMSRVIDQLRSELAEPVPGMLPADPAERRAFLDRLWEAVRGHLPGDQPPGSGDGWQPDGPLAAEMYPDPAHREDGV